MQIEITAKTICVTGIILSSFFLLSLFPKSKNIAYRPIFNIGISIKAVVWFLWIFILANRTFWIVTAIEILLTCGFILIHPQFLEQYHTQNVKDFDEYGKLFMVFSGTFAAIGWGTAFKIKSEELE